MKKLTILVLMLAFAWGASAQFYMHVWYNDSIFTFPVLKVDSITFTDKWLEPGEPVEPEPETPSEGIGVFSISADKQVTFSPGNLQYHPANNEWRFAENQLDYIGDANSNCSSTYDGWLDMFGWGTGDAPTKSSTSYSDYSTFVDWGTNKIGNDDPNTWRTLSYDEWEYLLNNRTNASSLKGVAQVNGVNGLILLPDSWTCPSGVTFKSGFHSSYYDTEYFAAHQTFYWEQWSKLEKSGAVFLPAAGDRIGSDVHNVQGNGFYWSATEDSYYAYSLCFYSGKASMYVYSRDTGFSVRLVKNIEGGGITPDTPDTPDTPTEPEEPENTENGYEYVDLGLSVKWATCNVGATKPEEYGDYFAWGETTKKSTYDWSTYKWCNGSSNTMTKYCDDYFYGSVDNKTVLEASDDAATANWGGNWRMPTNEEYEELRNNCTWTWTNQNGVKGSKVTSNKNGNSLFFPAAGCCDFGALNHAGSYGLYWSSSCLGSYQAYGWYFGSSDVGWGNNPRYHGRSVRPVCP